MMAVQGLCFTAIYLILLAHGLGFYVLCVPDDKVNLSGLATLAPVFGLSFISLYYTNTMASIPFSAAKPPFEIAMTVFTAGMLILKRKVFTREIHQFIRKARRDVKPYLFAGISFVLMAAGATAPVLDKPLTTFWRIGPDAGAYAASAKFILENKTLNAFPRTFTVPSEIYSYEFLIQVFRRGFAAAVAAVCDLLHLHPLQTTFMVAAVAFFLCLVVALRLAQHLLAGQPRFLPYLIAAAIGFNCNLLFILYEGGYAEIASLPLIMTVVLWQFDGIPVRPALKIFMGGVLLAASTGLYLESMLVIPMLAVGYGILEMFVQRRQPFSKNDALVLVGSVALAFALNWNVVTHWFRFERENSALLAIAGWAQPQWAGFPEIFGWINIYRHVIGNVPSHINSLAPWLAAVSYEMSFLFVGFILLGTLLGHRLSRIAMIPTLLILAAFCYFKFYRQVHSYSYMKIYTLLLPALTVGSLGSLLILGWPSRWTSALVTAASSLTIASGLQFIHAYRSDYAYLTAGTLELRNAATMTDLSHYVLLTQEEAGEFGGLREVFVRSLFASKLIHPGFFPEQDFSKHHMDSVALVLRKDGIKMSYDPHDVLWQGTDYIIVNTHVPVVNAWKDPNRIPWAPQPADIPRPEIEVRWNSQNSTSHAAQQYDFSKYFAVITPVAGD